MKKILLAGLAVAVSLALVPGVQSAAAVPLPSVETISIPLDIHPGYKPQKECSTSAKPGTQALLNLLIKNYGGSSLGISRSCASGGTSEHKEGRALDWKRDVKYASHRKAVDKAIKWLTANNGEVALRLGVMYIIWDQKLWSTYYPEMGWRKMANRGSYTQNHKNHVHISLTWDGAMMRTSWWTGVPVTADPCLTKSCSKGNVKYSSLTTTRPFTSLIAPLPFVPYPSQMPEISGSPIVGHTLGITIGNWAPANIEGPAFTCPASAECTYQWYRGSAKISGATQPTYTVQPSDYKKSINVEVTVTADGKSVKKKAGETTATMQGWVIDSPLPAAFPADVLVGETLSAAHQPWTPDDVISVKYQWLRDGKTIKGKTGESYTTVSADLGHKISVKLTGSATGYTTKTKTSAATKVVAEFTKAGTAKISGVNKVGGTLKVSASGWSPKPTANKYQWLRDGVPIAKATKASYVLVDADLGAEITVNITGTKSKYRPTVITAVADGPVAAGITIVKPVITGTAKYKKTLTVNPGEWGPEGVKLSYRWYRNGKSISKATKATYKLVAADKGKKITVKVTGSLSGYPTRSATSAATGKVKS
jgi:hypothetical protein